MSVSVLKRVARVPDEYQEVEYIESTGTQWIDTGETYVYGYKVNIEILDEPPYPTQALGYLGWWNASSQNNIQTYSGGLIVTRGTNNTPYYIGPPFNGEITVDGRNISTNDHSYSGNAISPDIDVSFTLFGYNRSTGVVNCSGKSRIRSAILFDENHNTTHNYIPCYRKSDNVIGMYDLVNGGFYTNSGTGTFLKGADIAPSYTVERQSINVLEMTLPKEYQQVEYIQSNGTQYIDTGFNPAERAGRFTWEIEVYNIYAGAAGSAAIGSRSQTTARNWILMNISASQNNQLGYGASTYNLSTNFSSGNWVVIKTLVDNGNYKLKIIANNQEEELSTPLQTFTNTANVYLFGANNMGSLLSSYPFAGKIKTAKLFDDGTLIRDFIPCYRKSDNVIGMFDLVSGTFFTNSGTGTFAKGDNVVLPIKRVRACILETVLPKAYQQVEYIESTGTQYIDTGYVPTNSSGIYLKAAALTKTEKYFVGVRDTSTDSRWCVGSGVNASNGYLVSYSSFKTLDQPANRREISLGTVFEYQLNYMNNRKRICNGVEGEDIGSQTLVTITKTAYIGGINVGGSFKSAHSARFYAVQFTEGNSVARDFIPCYRKSDSVVGLYDLVTKTFYTNSGTGTFSKGADATKYNIIRL